MDKKFIDIVFSDGVYSSINWKIRRNLDLRVCQLGLHYGNISNVLEFNSRKKDYLDGLFRFEQPEEFIYQNKFYDLLNELMSSDKKIRIWSGKRAAFELCGLYFFCFLLKNHELYLVDIPIINKLPHYDSSDYAESLNEYSNIDFHLIRDEEKDLYIDKWRNLKWDKKGLRISHHTGVLSMDYESYYGAILNCFDGNKQMTINQLEGLFLKEHEDALMYSQVQLIVKHMIDDGALRISKRVKKDNPYDEYIIYVKPVKVKKISNDQSMIFTSYLEEDKRNIVSFLRNKSCIAAAAMTIKDQINPEIHPGIEFDIYLYGPYLYSAQDIYHIEKYDMLITKEFNKMLLEKGIVSKIYRKKREL